MAYKKINWQNGTTPINETNLNHMDNQIATNEKAVADVQSELSQKLSNNNPNFAGILSTNRTNQSDTSDIINFTIQTEHGAQTFTVKPVLNGGGYVETLEIGGTIPVTFGDNVKIGGNGITEYTSLLSNGNMGTEDNPLDFSSDNTFYDFLSFSPDIIKITVQSEFFNTSNSNRTFILTRCPTQSEGIYIYIGHGYYFYDMNDKGVMAYTVFLVPNSLKMWFIEG